MSYRAVLFDMDGVIVDSEPMHIAAFKAVAQNHGYHLSDEQYERYFAGTTDEAGFRNYFASEHAEVDLSSILDEKSGTVSQDGGGAFTAVSRCS